MKHNKTPSNYYNKTKLIIKKIIFILILVSCWEIVSRLQLSNVQLIPPPSEILRAGLSLLESGALFKDIILSIKRVFIGFLISSCIAILISLISVLFKKGFQYINTLVELIRPIPPIAWIPIAILWFGIGDSPAYFIVSLGTFFPIFVNINTGIRSVEEKYIRVAKSFNVSKFLLFHDVILKITLPYLLAGIRIGLGVGWMSVITAELIGAQSGLGYMMQLNRVLLQTQNVMVGMAVVGILGYLMNRGMLSLEKILVPWRKEKGE